MSFLFGILSGAGITVSINSIFPEPYNVIALSVAGLTFSFISLRISYKCFRDVGLL